MRDPKDIARWLVALNQANVLDRERENRPGPLQVRDELTKLAIRPRELSNTQVGNKAVGVS